MELSGFPVIDQQHTQLLQSVSDLRMWIAKGSGHAISFTVALALLDYVRDHFSYEEQLLRRLEFPDLSSHLDQHMRMVEFSDRLYKKLLAGDDIADDLLNELEKWLLEHIEAEAKIFRTLDHRDYE